VFTLLFIAIDAVTGKIVFQIDGPGKVHADRAIVAGNFCND